MNQPIHKIGLFIAAMLLSSSGIYSMAGPGGGGGGDCFQSNTLGTIQTCTNCTIVDGSATGDLGADPTLIVTANSCGPVTVRIRYEYDWTQGANLNWIHGISVNAGPLWTAVSVTAPTGWTFMPNGLTGLCSGASYGAGYYYDAATASSGPTTITATFVGPGMCTSTYQNIGANLCTAVCTSNENLMTQISGNCGANGDSYPGNLGTTTGYPVPANDGNPGNNWGLNCTTGCPDFFFDLVYCPTNTNPTNFTEYIRFTTSADGESGAWCQDGNCDYSNGFNVTIRNACLPNAAFNAPPSNYCNAPNFNLGNQSAGYTGGTEWTGSTVIGSGSVNAQFSYCTNLNNTSISHTVGVPGCQDGPITRNYVVWRPLINNIMASPMAGCGSVTPTLSANVVIQQNGNPWLGAGTLEWLEGGTVVTNFTVTAGNCTSASRTFTPRFNTGCTACNVTGTPVTITAFPSYTIQEINNPANCGTATVNLIGTNGTVCQTVSAACPNPGNMVSNPYNWTGGAAGCTYNFTGTVSCNCTGCLANAGTVSANSPLCPGSTITASATGFYNDALYTQTYLLVNSSGLIVGVNPAGTFTAPATCGNYTVYSYNYLTSGTAPVPVAGTTNISTLTTSCAIAANCCNVSAPFTVVIGPPTPLAVNCPAPVNLTACATQTAIQTAYNAWSTGFSNSGGCPTVTVTSGPVASLPSYVCGAAINLTHTYTVTDGCSTTQSCTSTFTVPAAGAPLTVNCPSAVNLPACSSQSAVQTAYNAWVAGFTTSGGCGTINNNLASVPALPAFVCGAAINLSFTLSATDNCNITPLTCSSTFTVPASPAPPLAVNCAAAVNLPACTSQSAIQTAYNNWVAGFTVTGGCGIINNNLASIPALPAFVCGASVNLSFTLSATDDCNVTPLTCSSTFVVGASSTPLAVNCPAAVTLTACASQSDIQNAYNAWIAAFTTSGGCGPVNTNIASVPALPAYVCGAAVNLSFTYSATDDCNTTALTCNSTFTVPSNGAAALSVSCPAPVNLPSCSAQAAIQTAYNNWVAGFMVNGGCGTVNSNIASIPPLPAFTCGAPVNLSFTLSATDNCNITPQTCNSTFTVAAGPPPLTVNCTAPVTLPGCSAQTDIQSAYNAWVAGFSVTGGCGTVTSNIASIPALPSYACGDVINLSFTLNATDACNPSGLTCTSSFTVQICPPIIITPTLTQPSCGNNNGAISLGISGGTPPYSFSWTGGLAGQNPTGVPAGTYTVTVTGSGSPGCTAMATVVLNPSTGLTATLTPTQPTCGQNNGAISVSTTGGTPGYNYNWTGGLSGNNPMNVPPGNYTVTVSDSGTPACTDVRSVMINPSTAITLVDNVVHTFCGLNNGSITVTPSNGTAPYTYTWSNGNNTNNPTGLSSGSYSLTVSDAGSPACTVTASYNVNPSAGITLTPSSTPTTCGLNNGTISIAVIGGTSPYSFNWTGGLSGQNPTGVPAGTYSVTVTGSGSPACTAETSVTISPSTGVTATLTPTQTTCGQNNGAISVSVSGGIPGYNYNWTGGLSGSNPMNVAPGTYSVTVSDSATPACTNVRSVTINTTTAITMVGTVVHTSCGMNNGSISVSPSGGAGPYTYAWSNGNNTNNPTGLSSGNYTVTVSDSGSPACTATDSYIVNPSTGITLTPSSTPTTCGLNNGTISIVPSGGTPPYSYNWTGGLAGQNPTGVAAGTYTVTVTGSGNPACTAETIVTIAPSSAVQLSLTPVNASCGQINGTINTSVTGGSPGYSYNWTGGLTGSNPVNVPQGTYTVTVTDSGTPACTDVETVTITTTTAVSLTESITHTTCGLNNGSITVTPANGTAPYTYVWSNGNNTNNPTGLASGNYTVTVSDSGSPACTVVGNYTVNPTTAITLSPVWVPTSCGLNNGSITLNPAGGTPPYNYNWTGGLTGPNPTNVASGTYTVTVTGSGTPACTATASVIINPSTGITASGSVTQPICGASNGEILVSVSGGNAPYTYNWSGGLSGSNPTGLNSGTYFVTVSDNSSPACTFTTSFNVNTSSDLSMTSVENDPTCGLNNGSIQLTVTGGTAPYTYTWTNGLTGSNPVDLSPGLYTLTVSDNGNPACEIVRSFNLQTDIPIVMNPTVVPTTCGQNNGAITLNVSGGIAPYIYTWTGGLSGASPFNVPSGTYFVTVTDSDNPACTSTTTVVVDPSVALVVSGSTTPSSCGINNGAILLAVSGATAPYSYTWSGGLSGINPTGVAPANYNVTVTDSGSPACTTVRAFNVTAIPNLTVVPSITQPTCGQSNGAISISVGGGTGPYTYNWSTGAAGTSLTNLAGGAYSVTITDSHTPACEIIRDYSLNIVQPVSVTGTVVNTFCGNNNGAITLSVSGGTAPFSFAWTGGLTGSSPINVAAGSYSVTVTDAASCTSTANFTVLTSSGINVAVTTTPVSCGLNNGTISLTVSGGTGPYTYNWTGGLSGPNPMNVGVGNYTVTVSDSGSPVCSVTRLVTLSSLSNLTVQGSVSDPTCGLSNGSISLNVNGGTGPYSYLWSTGSTGTSLNNITGGAYSVTVSDSGSPVCSVTENFNVILVQPIAAAAVVTNTSCGNSNGAINLGITGGSPPFSFTWSGGLTGSSPINVGSGNYNLTVTDAVGCTGFFSYVVAASTAVTPTAVINAVSCGQNNGSIQLSVTGGTGPYSYAWSGGLSGSSPSGLGVGSYSVTISDSGNPVCSAIRTYSVSSLSNLLVSGTPVQPTCGLNNGSVTLTVTGGTAPYTYLWSDGSTGSALMNAGGGSHSVTVTDSGSPACAIPATFMLNDILPVTIIENINPTTCSNTNGAISINITGGTAPYSFSWSGGLTGTSPINVASGTYALTVTDTNGCSAAESYTVAASTAVAPTADITAASCGVNNGAIELTVTGGTAPYSYNWSGGLSGNNPSGLAVGSYSVTVTDSGAPSCSVIRTYSVGSLSSLAIMGNTTQPTCGLSNGAISITATGGTAPYTYEWSDMSTGTSISNLQGGSYSVTVTDSGNPVCQVSEAFTLNVNSPVSVTHVADPTSCGLNNGTITLSPSGGSAPYNFAWSGGLTGQNPINVAGGTYNVTVSDNSTPSCTAVVSGIVVNTSVATLFNCGVTQPVSEPGLTDGVAFVNITSGVAPFTITWSGAGSGTLNGVPTGNNTISDLVEGVYNITVTDANGCTATCDFNMPATGLECAINIQNLVTGTCDNNNTNNTAIDDTFTITFNVRGTATAANYTLIVNGVSQGPRPYNIPVNLTFPANGQQVTIRVVDADDPDCDDTVTVNAPGSCSVCNVSVNAGADAIIDCTNTSAAFTAQSVPAGATFTWSGPGGFSQTGATVDVSIAGTYTVTAAYADGCTATDSAVLSVSASIPQATASANRDLSCKHSSVTLTGTTNASGPNISYQWTNAAGQVIGTAISYTADSAGNYFFQVIDNSSNCRSALAPVQVLENLTTPTAIIYASPTNLIDCQVEFVSLYYEEELNTSYEWEYNGVTSIEGQIKVAEAGLAILLAIDTISGCIDVDSLQVLELIQYPIIRLNNPGQIDCDNNGVTISSAGSQTGANISYQWLANGTPIPGATSTTLFVNNPGLYYLELVDSANGCTNRDSVQVTGSAEVPVALVGPDRRISCITNVAPISGVGSSSGNQFTYAWINTTSGAQVSTQLSTSVNAPGTYVLQVTNTANGCVRTDTLRVEPASIPALAVAALPLNCFESRDGRITVTGVQGGTPPFAYRLNNGNPGQQTVFANLNAGSYQLQVTDAEGCTDARTITLTQPDKITLSIDGIDKIVLGEKTTLEVKVNSQQGQFFNVLWTPQTDVACPTCPKTEVSPQNTITYTVKITDDAGCEAETRITVAVDRSVTITVPQIFSPNGDGRNDFFNIFTKDPSIVQVEKVAIFDRWGNMVYFAEDMDINNQNAGWDGKYKGQYVPNGVYVYVIHALLRGNEKRLLKGDITVNR
jgi:gliding motility-associated-like protein